MDDRILQIQKLLDAADGNLSSARTIIRELTSDDSAPIDLNKKLEDVNAPTSEGTVIEGIFDGEQMVAPDGKTYPIPPNYASKSKLVEGDTLKLTIADDGSFLFKQIAPIERRSAVGTLALADGNYTISAEGKSYKVLTASVTFYKAEPGDQVTITLPKDHDAVWASLENVIKKGIETDSSQQVLDNNDEPIADTTPAVIPEEVIVPVPQVTDEVSAAEPALASESQPETPEIEFPNGVAEVSDEQLLENLKNNLRNIDQPSYVAPEVAASAPKPASPDARQVDNIVANDLAQLQNQQSGATSPIADDKPIAELDI